MTDTTEHTGLTRLDAAFAKAKSEGRGALMPFVCAGHPTPDALPAVLRSLAEAGADAVEIGFPFSDPIADGPVIAAAMHEALTAGYTTDRLFDQIASVRGDISIPLIAMVSASIVEGLSGPAAFAERAASAGFDGLIIPDLPLEESERARQAAADNNLGLALLIAPTTPAERAAKIAKACTGFVYLVARAGVTGERGEAPEIERLVGPIRSATQTPIACGFGIATADHVRAVTKHADAAIVGSALVRKLSESKDDPAAAARNLTTDLAASLTN